MVPDAPEGSVYSTIASDNYKAGELAAENLYDALKDTLAAASSPVELGKSTRKQLLNPLFPEDGIYR